MELKYVAVFHLCYVSLTLLRHLWIILSCPREVIQLAEENELLEILERVVHPKLYSFSVLFYTMFKARQVY